MRFGAVAWAGMALALGVPAAAPAIVANPHNLVACTRCHREAPQFGIDTARTVSFNGSPDDPALCLPCHLTAANLHPVGVEPGAGPAGARRSEYLRPARSGALAGRVVCTSCHFIHAADGRYALLRGFPGSPDPRYFPTWQAFCAECHGANLEGRTPHGGAPGACVFCHAARPVAGRPAEVVARDGGVCLLCHVRARETHGRDINPTRAELVCARCHDAHLAAGDRPGLLSDAYLAAAVEDPAVRPHYRRGLCLACHANTDDFALRGDDVNATCNRCHDSGRIPPNIHPLRRVPPSISPPKGWPLEGGALTCLTCHEQGHEDQTPTRNMLRGGPYARPRDVCRSCHTGLDLLSSTIHADINEGKRCEFCHKEQPVVGRDRFEDVTLIADPDLLCLRCHEVEEGSRSHHRTVGDPEFDPEKVPDFLPTYRGRVICATCHNPHLLEPTNFRLRGRLEATNFCQDCHKS